MARTQLQKLGTYLRPHWRQATLGIGALLIVNALGVYLPLVIRNGIDDLQVTFSMDQILYYVVIVFVLASVMWVIRMVSRIALFGVGRRVEFDLKQKIFEHLLTLEPSYFANNTVGEQPHVRAIAGRVEGRPRMRSRKFATHFPDDRGQL